MKRFFLMTISLLMVFSLVSSFCFAESASVLVVKESGFAMNSGYLYYSVILHNNSDSIAVEFPSFRITSRDANDALLGTDEHVLSIIYPGQDFVSSGQAYSLDDIPAKVDFEIIDPDDYHLTPPSRLEHSTFLPLEIVGSNKKGTRILGEVYNPNDYTIDSAVVTVVFRDDNGKLLAGDSTYIDKIKAGAKVPFDMDVSKYLITDNYEIYANLW